MYSFIHNKFVFIFSGSTDALKHTALTQKDDTTLPSHSRDPTREGDILLALHFKFEIFVSLIIFK